MNPRLLIAFFILILTSCSQKVKETFLIPDGFEGRIEVIFNQPSAEPIPIENGRRIYRIPSDGILISSSKLEVGWLGQEYYYVDAQGRRSKIPVQNKDSKDIPEKPTVIVYGITGVYGNSSDSNPLNFVESIIVSKTSNDSIFSPTNLKEFELRIKKKTGRTF